MLFSHDIFVRVLCLTIAVVWSAPTVVRKTRSASHGNVRASLMDASSYESGLNNLSKDYTVRNSIVNTSIFNAKTDRFSNLNEDDTMKPAKISLVQPPKRKRSIEELLKMVTVKQRPSKEMRMRRQTQMRELWAPEEHDPVEDLLVAISLTKDNEERAISVPLTGLSTTQEDAIMSAYEYNWLHAVPILGNMADDDFLSSSLASTDIPLSGIFTTQMNAYVNDFLHAVPLLGNMANDDLLSSLVSTDNHTLASLGDGDGYGGDGYGGVDVSGASIIIFNSENFDRNSLQMTYYGDLFKVNPETDFEGDGFHLNSETAFSHGVDSDNLPRNPSIRPMLNVFHNTESETDADVNDLSIVSTAGPNELLLESETPSPLVENPDDMNRQVANHETLELFGLSSNIGMEKDNAERGKRNPQYDNSKEGAVFYTRENISSAPWVIQESFFNHLVASRYDLQMKWITKGAGAEGKYNEGLRVDLKGAPNSAGKGITSTDAHRADDDSIISKYIQPAWQWTTEIVRKLPDLTLSAAHGLHESWLVSKKVAHVLIDLF